MTFFQVLRIKKDKMKLRKKRNNKKSLKRKKKEYTKI